MSGASAPSQPQTGRLADAAGATVPGGAEVDSCPLCGAPLHPEQEWCLRCGAAARTRLAASSNWKAPIIALAVVGILSLGVLAAALVRLAGGFSSTTDVTRTIAGGPASVTSPGTAAPTPAPSATPPAASTVPASTLARARPVALGPVIPVAPSIVDMTGAVNPQGVPTTYQFQFGPTASYGVAVPGKPTVVGAGTAAVGVSARLRLAPATTYHYRLTVTKAGRRISTPDATYTTPR